MKKLIACTLAIICVFTVLGNTSTDSIKVYFKLSQSTYEPMLDNNAVSVDSFIEKVTALIASDELMRIVITGYASPEGPEDLNKKLARKRCETLADIVLSRTRVSPRLVDTQSIRGGESWNLLQETVINDLSIPNRDKILKILNNDTGRTKTLQQIKAIDNGATYHWLLKHIFPKLRYAVAIAIYRKSDPMEKPPQIEEAIQDTIAEAIQDTIAEDIADIATIADIADSNTLGNNSSRIDSVGCVDTYRPRHLLALKTNLLYYAALMPNLELEYLFHDNWSAALNGNIAWWWKNSSEQSYRVATLDAEMRYWIKPRAPWHGFYAGVFAGGGMYDLENGGNGYQGEGVMTGISCGFMWPIKRNLSFEAGIGGGYAYTRAKEYKPYEGHYVYQRTKAYNYFGPLKLKFSIVWRFLDKNKLNRPRPQI